MRESRPKRLILDYSVYDNSAGCFKRNFATLVIKKYEILLI
jgi:hypothetical protein